MSLCDIDFVFILEFVCRFLKYTKNALYFDKETEYQSVDHICGDRTIAEGFVLYSYPIPRKNFTPPDLYYGKRGVKFFRRKGNKPPREQVNKGAYFCLENSYLFLYI